VISDDSTSTNSDDPSEINEPKIFDDEHAVYLFIKYEESEIR
jgi:hypothetical protein